MNWNAVSPLDLLTLHKQNSTICSDMFSFFIEKEKTGKRLYETNTIDIIEINKLGNIIYIYL